MTQNCVCCLCRNSRQQIADLNSGSKRLGLSPPPPCAYMSQSTGFAHLWLSKLIWHSLHSKNNTKVRCLEDLNLIQSKKILYSMKTCYDLIEIVPIYAWTTYCRIGLTSLYLGGEVDSPHSQPWRQPAWQETASLSPRPQPAGRDHGPFEWYDAHGSDAPGHHQREPSSFWCCFHYTPQEFPEFKKI